MPSTNDLYWAAGFLEGEGSFLSNKTGGGRSRTVAIQCQQVQREPLERLQAAFGGKIHTLSDRPGRQTCHSWKITGARARGVMMTLYLLMSPKRRDQIRASLAVPTRKYVRKAA